MEDILDLVTINSNNDIYILHPLFKYVNHINKRIFYEYIIFMLYKYKRFVYVFLHEFINAYSQMIFFNY